MEIELVRFLESFPSPKTLLTASPKAILRYFVWKDSKGKTKLHADRCPYMGQQGKRPCRLAAGTVDFVIGKLLSYFNNKGRSVDWNDTLCQGNPATHHLVKSYLKSVQLEQAQARVSPKQATPMFFDIFYKILSHLRTFLQDPKISPTERYILSRDLAFFTLNFSTGDRASDLGRVKTVNILPNPDGRNLLIHQRVGKTLRGKRTRAFPIRQCKNPAICPVRNLEFYMDLSRTSGLNLLDGYLFRPTSKNGRVLNSPFLVSAVQARLSLYRDSLR
jgi:integrase